jgi:hypothetical protein
MRRHVITLSAIIALGLVIPPTRAVSRERSVEERFGETVGHRPVESLTNQGRTDPTDERKGMSTISSVEAAVAAFTAPDQGTKIAAGGDKNAEGYFGRGHDLLHENFYMQILRPDTGTSCCSGEECRPTSGRMVSDHYEVKINGLWVQVPWNKIVKQAAPDLGYHVCAPAGFSSSQPHQLFCVILPPES